MLEIKKQNSNRVIVATANRSAAGKIPGMLTQMRDVELLANVFNNVARDINCIIDSAIVGSAFPIERDNLCRKAVLASEIPSQINCITVSKTCASSDEALSLGYMRILAGKSNAILIGGCEKVSNSSYTLSFMKERVKHAIKNQLPCLCDIKKNVTENDMHYLAEILAYKHGISREEQDLFAINSRQRAYNAYKKNKFKNEIIPIKYAEENEDKMSSDEWIQIPFDKDEVLQALPIFIQNGMLTKYNTAPMCDVAAAMIITSYDTFQTSELDYLVDIKDVACVSVPQEEMGCAMEKCVRKILEDNHLDKEEIDLYEINESFAVQAIITIQALEINPNRVNVNGGNLALGYPIGASGLRMCVTLVHEMVRSKSKYGISVMCGGGTMANAVLFHNSAI